MSTIDVTRRQVLATSAAAATLLATATAYASEDPQEAWDYEADIVIVGAGGTGLACAAEAAGKASVILLEKTSFAGGCTGYSGAVMQAAGTPLQKACTPFQDDTPEKHFQFYMQAGEGLIDEDIVRTLCYAAPDCLAFMESLGIEYDSVYGACHIPGISDDLQAWRIHSPKGAGNIGSGQGHVQALLAAAEAGGAQVIYETPATALVRDPAGRVVGVIAEGPEGQIRVHAHKGVLLAAAGIDTNPALAKDLNPQQYYDLTEQACYCPPANSGDGIRMGLEAGAALTGLGGTISTMLNGVGGGSYGPFGQQLLLNAAGRRFVCEDATYAYPCRAIFQQERQLAGPVWVVFGGTTLNDPESQWSNADTLAAALEAGGEGTEAGHSFGTGALYVVDDLPALAEATGMDEANLQATFDQWNNDMASGGMDRSFGRTSGLYAIEPPYYFQRASIMNLGAIGGLKVNTKAQVIGASGEVIPGLYAGGMNAGGWIGPYYPGSGTAIVGTVFWGRTAAQSMLETH